MADRDERTFTFGNTDDEHFRGDPNCGAGHCGAGYPQPCRQDGCTGLVHANFGDEGYFSYWQDTQCDACGKEE